MMSWISYEILQRKIWAVYLLSYPLELLELQDTYLINIFKIYWNTKVVPIFINSLKEKKYNVTNSRHKFFFFTAGKTLLKISEKHTKTKGYICLKLTQKFITTTSFVQR